jgi:hypothetical protein
MAKNLAPRVPILLALTRMSDADLHDLADTIKKAAPTSKLCSQNPAMAASAATIDTKAAAFDADNQTVAEDRRKLVLDIAAEALTRTALVAELRTYATLATNGALLPADLQGAGLTYRDTVVAKLPPGTPGLIDVLPSKVHGKVRVAVHETGTGRRQYVAQQSLDGTNWTPLGLGHGKMRTVTGTSGTKVWVRFASIRGEQQSDWSIAQLVTIP